MEYSILADLVEKPISGEWGNGDGTINVIRTTNFTNNGRINFAKIVGRDVPENKVKAKKLQIDDIIIEKSGGSPTQPVGRVVFFDRDGLYLCNNFTSVLRPLKQLVYPKYLHYILFCNHKFGYVTKFQNKTTGIINLQLAKYLKNTKIPLPPLAEQQQIAAILDAADSLKQKDQQLIDHYTALSQSLFLDMFGDPSNNPKGFKRCAIGEVVKIQGGSQPPKKIFKTELVDGYVRLVQIRDYKTDKYLTYVPEKSTKKFCTEKDIMIGRYGPPVFQILRGIAGAYNVALMKAVPLLGMDTEYAFQLLSCSYLQNIVIGNSKRTAGQTGVNLKLLNSIEVSVPPINLQSQFAKRIDIIEQQKQQAKLSLENSEALFNSLLQRAFTGELTAKKLQVA